LRSVWESGFAISTLRGLIEECVGEWVCDKYPEGLIEERAGERYVDKYPEGAYCRDKGEFLCQ
jgi:hypothetical protein